MHVGLDIGYGQTKLSFTSDPYTPARNLVLHSGAAPFELCPTDLGSSSDARNEIVRVMVDGREWGAFVDPDAIAGGVSYLNEDFTRTEAYLAIYKGALAMLRSTEVDHIVTGLPVEYMRDDERVHALQSRLSGKHVIREGRVVNVKRVEVIPQAVGAYYGASDTVPANSVKYETVLVIDVGHYSADWVYLVDQAVRREFSGSSFRAGAAVLQDAAAYIDKECSVPVTAERLFRIVRDGADVVSIAGKRIDVRAAVAHGSATVSELVLSKIKSCLREAGAVSLVLLTGGGARFFEEATKAAFEHARVVVLRNPVMANANGFRLWSMRPGAAT